MDEIGRNQKFKIYVGAIPAKISSNEVKQYFSKFGQIDDVLMFFNSEKDGARSAQRLNKGYCHLVVPNEEIRNAIISYTKHTLWGREILCESFIRGKELRKCNQLNNDRRVIAKNLPINFTVSDLVNSFSSFGELTRAYFFPSSSTSRNLTASLQFQSPKSASWLLSQSSMTIQGQRIKPVPYVKNHGKSCAFIKENRKQDKKSSEVTSNLTPGISSTEMLNRYESNNMPWRENTSSGIADVARNYIKPTCRAYHRDWIGLHSCQDNNVEFRLLTIRGGSSRIVHSPKTAQCPV